MIRSLFLIALMAVLSFAAAPASAPLSVSNGKIVDKSGNPFVLRGMSLFWNRSDWPGGKFYKQSTVTTLAGSSWNANVVRAAIGNGDTQDAKNFMDWTWNAGIYVIVDWHYHTLEQSGATSFFNTVASYAKEKGYNHVIYEIFNEPCSGAAGTSCGSAISWSSIKSYSESIISTIRAQDNNGLIIVGTPNYSSDLGSARRDPIAADKARNILYSLHFYTSDPGHNAYMANLQVAWCNNFPVFASEWGTSMADGGDKDKNMDWNRTNSWMSLVETLGISWANWSIVDKDETAAALTLNCCGSGTFGDNNLSASGQYVQRIMKNRNSGGAITSANGGNPAVSLTQVNVDCGNAAQKGDKTGNVKVGTATNAVDFVPGSMSGLKDSVVLNSAYVLQNSGNTFSVGYKIVELPGTGKYRMRIRYGSTSATTVSWSGSGVESGSAELPSTGGDWKNSDYIPITVTASPEAPLNLTFNGGAANSFVFVNILVATDPSNPPTPGSSSSGGDPSPIISVSPNGTNSGAFAIKNGVNLQVAQKASIEVFNLNGKSMRKMNLINGSYYISLSDLPKGLYIVKVKLDNRSEILRIPVK
ncbi:MAG: cellulase family glycosylhydrolase [Fibromonadaceae bacterium]|jgi:endoglucanase|nr:cellulase family glycosylhydrolase [Fibromonadaceae bacterium]